VRGAARKGGPYRDLDADIRDFFGQLDRAWLKKFLEHRIADKRVLRLIDKWLAAGVIEDGMWMQSEVGSPQGASVSFLLANVYLHYVLTCGSTGGDAASRTAM
jgi:retron-type reverse transcriptase